MINEKMLDYLMLDNILYTDGFHTITGDELYHSGKYDKMFNRHSLLKDEFINQYKLPIHTIKNPLSDTIDMEK